MSDHLTLAEKHDLLERANQRTVVAKGATGTTIPIRGFGGALRDFPSLHTDFGSAQISWALLARVANGETDVIGV